MKMLFPMLLLMSACALRPGIQTPQGVTIRPGMKLGRAMRSLGLDSNAWHLIQEPPGIAHGIDARLPDGSLLWLRTERFGHPRNENILRRALPDKRITGIAIARPDCSTQIKGRGFLHFDQIMHPNCGRKK